MSRALFGLVAILLANDCYSACLDKDHSNSVKCFAPPSCEEVHHQPETPSCKPACSPAPPCKIEPSPCPCKLELPKPACQASKPEPSPCSCKSEPKPSCHSSKPSSPPCKVHKPAPCQILCMPPQLPVVLTMSPPPHPSRPSVYIPCAP